MPFKLASEKFGGFIQSANSVNEQLLLDLLLLPGLSGVKYHLSRSFMK